MKFIGDLMAKAKKKLTRKKAVAKAAPTVEAPKPVEPPAPEPVSVQINVKYLRAMRHVAPERDIRYYLNGVFFQTTKEGGKFYVATDGHRIAVIQEPWKDGEERQDIALLIPRPVSASAKPFSKDILTSTLRQVDPLTWTLDGKEVSQTFKPIDGKFPEWKKVMPTSCSGEIGAFNWDYLHDFNRLTKEAFGAKWSCEVRHNGTSAALVTCGSNSFLGMLMPMRMSEGTVPAWAVEIQKENEKKKKAEAANEQAPLAKAA